MAALNYAPFGALEGAPAARMRERALARVDEEIGHRPARNALDRS